jgi:hypothetical protein
VALVWNEREARDPLMHDLRELEKRAGEAAMLAGVNFSEDSIEPLLRGAGSGPIRWLQYEHVQVVDKAGLVGRVRSTSFAPRSGPDLVTLLSEVDTLYARYANAGGRLSLRYRTELIMGDLGSA